MLLKQLFRNRTATVGESYPVGDLMTVRRYRESMDSLDRLPDNYNPVSVCLVKDLVLQPFPVHAAIWYSLWETIKPFFHH